MDGNGLDPELERFNMAIVAMLETFGQEATAARLRGYELGLVGVPIDSVELAVAKSLQSNRLPPKPAELREIAAGGSAEDLAIAAWADVQRALPLGPYKHVQFDDGLINATIRSLGGWPAMFDRLTSAEEEKWYRLNFLKTYQSLARTGVNGEACAALPGLSEAELVNRKTVAPRPRRVGCDETRKRLSHSVVIPQKPLRLPEVKQA